MPPHGRVRLFALLSLAGLMGGVTCSRHTTPDPVRSSQAPAASLDAGTPACAANKYCQAPLMIGPELPETLRCTLQPQVDLFAWNEFIALNWRARGRGMPDTSQGPDSFGDPTLPDGGLPTVVWQSFWTPAEVFPAGTASPGSGASASEVDCALPPGVAPDAVLASSSFEALDKFTALDSLQADQEWLADKHGNLVWYQLLMNGTERDYIVARGLFKAQNQLALSRPGKPGVDPPQGSVEIKAAWRQLTDPSEYGRYLTVNACLPGPGGKKKLARLGLVGLHIVHKTDNQPRWTWATFEHVDNAPDCGGKDPCTVDCQGQDCTRYSFYDPSCTPQAIPSQCQQPDAGTQTSCTPNTAPAYTLGAWFDGGVCPPYPIQVARERNIPDSGANPMQCVNAFAQEQIRQANSDSVFQYYQLVSALWWSAPSSDPMDGGVAVPLTTQGLQILPPGSSVANTTLETYVQNTSCLDCHQYAAIADAGVPGACGGKDCAADYSFFFQKAKQ